MTAKPEYRGVETGTFSHGRNMIRDALMSVADIGTHVDSGGGLGNSDFWVRIGGVEYYLTARLSNSELAKNEP